MHSIFANEKAFIIFSLYSFFVFTEKKKEMKNLFLLFWKRKTNIINSFLIREPIFIFLYEIFFFLFFLKLTGENNFSRLFCLTYCKRLKVKRNFFPKFHSLYKSENTHAKARRLVRWWWNWEKFSFVCVRRLITLHYSVKEREKKRKKRKMYFFLLISLLFFTVSANDA